MSVARKALVKRIIVSVGLKLVSICAALAALSLAAWMVFSVVVNVVFSWRPASETLREHLGGGLLVIALAVAKVGVGVGVVWFLARLARRLAVFSAKRGRQATAASADELMTRDPRPPVLYLRSFFDDLHGEELDGSFLSSLSSRTEEEQIGRVVSELGPFVAVGKPGEALPALGAARAYLADSEWQSRVTGLLRCSRVVLLRTGLTAGFSWELERAVALVKPERLVLLVDEGDEDYEFFREKVGGLLPQGLPPLSDSRKKNGALRGLVVFEPDWKPSYVPLEKGRASFIRRSVTYPLAAPLKYALRSVWEHLNVRWRPPEVAVLPIAILAVTTWIGFMALAMAIPPLFHKATPAFNESTSGASEAAAQGR